MRASYLAMTALVAALPVFAQRSVPIRPDSLLVAETRFESIAFAGDTIRFGMRTDSSSFVSHVRHIWSTNRWQVVRELVPVSRERIPDPGSLDTIAPGWALDRDYSRNRAAIVSLSDGRRYPTAVRLGSAGRAALWRDWQLARDDSMPEFATDVSAYARAGDYLWLGLGGGSYCDTESNEHDPSGAVVQFNVRTRAMRFLLPPQLYWCGVQSVVAANSYLWVATAKHVLRYRVIPDSGVRPAPVDTTYARGMTHALASDGRLVAIATDSGISVADGAAGQWRTQWFHEDEAADTTTRWIAGVPPVDPPWDDTVGVNSYSSRRGVRFAMDMLRLPLARRAAFRAAARTVDPALFVALYETTGGERFSRNAFTVFNEGASEAAWRALAQRAFIPFLRETLTRPDVFEDAGDDHRGVALNALIDIPDSAGRAIARGILDTISNPRFGVEIAVGLHKSGDETARRWLLARLRDREFMARDVVAGRDQHSLILHALYQDKDSAFTPALLALLADSRLTRYAYGLVIQRASQTPSLWPEITRRASMDSSLVGALLSHAVNDSSLLFGPRTRPVIERLARRIMSLGPDSASRMTFALDTRWDVDLVSSAVNVAMRYRDPAIIPDLLRLVSKGNLFDAAAASEALVELSGRSDAPFTVSDADRTLRPRLIRFWNSWWASARRPFVPVSEAVGEAARRRFRARG